MTGGLIQRRLALAAWILALTTALAALSLPGHDALAGPPLTSPAEWLGWASSRQPADVVVALVRQIAIASCWYLLAATGAGIAARAIGARSLLHVADALTLPSVRAVVRWTLGAGLTATTAFAGPPALAAGPAPPAITMTRLPEAADPAPAPSPTPALPATWEVRPHENLWHIARNVVAVRLAREPFDREVMDYWRALIETNRARLADPDNPHLVLPGQVFRLP